MADEYIRRQDVVDYCKALMNAEVVQNTDDWGYGKERYNQTEVILEYIENRQPADVAPVVHGKWIHMGCGVFECDKCGKRISTNVYVREEASERFKYCPNCGAKMEE